MSACLKLFKMHRLLQSWAGKRSCRLIKTHFQDIDTKIVLACFPLKSDPNKHCSLFVSSWNLIFSTSWMTRSGSDRAWAESAKQHTSVHPSLLTFWPYSPSGTSECRPWVCVCLCMCVLQRAPCPSTSSQRSPRWADYYTEATRWFWLVGRWDGWLLCTDSLCTVLMMLSARWGVGMHEGGGVHGGEKWGWGGCYLSPLLHSISLN